MSYAVWFKAGCETSIIAPSGVRILAAIHATAQLLGHDLVVTCGCDSHPASDPHSKGQAFDVRSHDLTAAQKQSVLETMMAQLQDDPSDLPIAKDGGYVTKHFFGWLEHEGQENEHFHWQQRNGVAFP